MVGKEYAAQRDAERQETANNTITYRQVIWDDLQAVVDEYDSTWGFQAATHHKGISELLSWHCVLRYLVPSTFCAIAEQNGTFLGVIFARVDGCDPLFVQAQEALDEVDAKLCACEEGQRVLANSLRWQQREQEMEEESDEVGEIHAEIELFLVSQDARGQGVGSELGSLALEYFHACGEDRYFLHTDTGCDIGFYEYQGLNRLVERRAQDYPEDMRKGSPKEDLFIYDGEVEVSQEGDTEETGIATTGMTGADERNANIDMVITDGTRSVETNVVRVESDE